MNLLVTNTRNGQAYCIIRSLRKQASKVIGTVDGENRLVARLAPAALSRFVDKVYHVPSLVDDWRRGSIEHGDTEPVHRFIREILRICEKERIDVVFPSWDPQICAFSRNKYQFTQKGIVLPVPEWRVLSRLVDKYRLMHEATVAGFPRPETFLPKDEGDALDAAQQLGFPLVVKPRFSSGSRGTCLVRNEAELVAAMKKCVPIYGAPMLQEYIGGGNSGLINLIVVLDRGYRLRAFHSRRVVRSVSERFASTTSAEVCMHDSRLAERAADLLRNAGYYGHAALQLQRDARDGIPKLLEINCRISYRAWCEIDIGFHLPLLTLQVERGENIPCMNGCRREMMFVYPVEDTIGRLSRGVRGGRDDGQPTLLDWYFKSLWTDPLHAISWYGTRLRAMYEEMRRPDV